MIVSNKSPAEVADQFEVTIIWMDETQLVPGRNYFVKIGTQIALATISYPKFQINVDNLEKISSKTLKMNSIGVATVTLDRKLTFTKYNRNRELGGIIFIDKMTYATAGAGLIKFALRRSSNIQWHETEISRDQRAKLKNQKPMVLWMTGISGSGKSTIANDVERKLSEKGYHTFLLDGDNVRHGLNKDLGFTDADRIENLRRVGEVAKLMADAGLIVIVAFISPFITEREMVRRIFKDEEYAEIFIDTPIHIAEKRDPKGLYAKARKGELKNFTGVDSPYEPPEDPDVHIETEKLSIEQSSDIIVEKFFSERPYFFPE